MAMRNLNLVLGDQLHENIASLRDHDRARDMVLICEVMEEAKYVRHHGKKIAFLFSCMRHFAGELAERDYNVKYVTLDDPANTGSFAGEVARMHNAHGFERIVITHPGEYRVLADMRTWHERLGIPVEIREDDRFLITPGDFAAWAKTRKQLRMEHFYRHMRRKYDILMEGAEPVGGQWNYDAANRKPPRTGLDIPAPYDGGVDHITKDVLALVAERFNDHFGDLEPFYFAVTRKQALEALNLFIAQRLGPFGDYQDAMLEGEAWMYHSHVSFYLNCGLLLPMECIKAAETAYADGRVPLNAAEGFIRQILGWREYVRGIYWLAMPEYAGANFFGAHRPLPDFYWTAETKMNCMHQCISETRKNAYAHHIQRLMVLGNFALLAGIDPAAVNEWYLIVYADAYEWVEMPNVTGMILFADGGLLASKPYAAGGNYINKMSDYCRNCAYKVSEKHGANACPFNYLYWNFLQTNRPRLESNHRMRMMYATLDRMPAETRAAIRDDSRAFLQSMEK